MNESSCCSTSSPAFGVASVLDFGHSNRYVRYLIVLIFISLMTYDVEHIFVQLFEICISSLVKYLFRSLSHFILTFFFFLPRHTACDILVP